MKLFYILLSTVSATSPALADDLMFSYNTVNGGVKTGHVAAQNQASVWVLSAMARALTK